MPELIEKTPCDGLLPLSAAGVTLSEIPWARITSLAPFAGKDRAAATALKALGLGWPAPGRAVTGGEAACLWAGRRLAFLVDAEPAGLGGVAMLTDQSDAWARMRLAGKAAEATLARLVPLDLRLAAFPTGSVVRTGLNHIMVMLHRVDTEIFEIMVIRSMAVTAAHDLYRTMTALAARQAI